jgi:hypothetical protein
MADEPIFVNCCHCRQCQKISGSAFAINCMIEADRVEILRGEDELALDDEQARCRQCGVLLWAGHRLFGDRIKFLRLGTLDESERIEPTAHFFVRSKHPWITVPDGIPQIETLPSDRDPPLMSAESAARLEAVRAS